MTGEILQFEDLQRLCRPRGPAPRAATVVRWAERQKIRYKYDSEGRIWTTLAAINAALGLSSGTAAADQSTERPEDLI